MKTTVVFHSADFDGLFCGQIARKFLPDAELIGWDFGDDALPLPKPDTKLYVLDLPLDRPFGLKLGEHKTIEPVAVALDLQNAVWIDHHASSIATHPKSLQGYRIDGVAACRLAWQWFLKRVSSSVPTTTDDLNAIQARIDTTLPTKQDFIDRTVSEPLAVRLAGEYDIWDKRDPNAELFQHGLRSEIINFDRLLNTVTTDDAADYAEELLTQGECLQFYRANEYRDVITQQGFLLNWEGLQFLACNSHELDIRSQLFEAGIKPYHDALLGFTFTGKDYRVSLYRIQGKDADILSVAKKYGGGGHVGACGFRSEKLGFLQ